MISGVNSAIAQCANLLNDRHNFFFAFSRFFSILILICDLHFFGCNCGASFKSIWECLLQQFNIVLLFLVQRSIRAICSSCRYRRSRYCYRLVWLFRNSWYSNRLWKDRHRMLRLVCNRNHILLYGWCQVLMLFFFECFPFLSALCIALFRKLRFIHIILFIADGE